MAVNRNKSITCEFTFIYKYFFLKKQRVPIEKAASLSDMALTVGACEGAWDDSVKHLGSDGLECREHDGVGLGTRPSDEGGVNNSRTSSSSSGAGGGSEGVPELTDATSVKASTATNSGSSPPSSLIGAGGRRLRRLGVLCGACGGIPKDCTRIHMGSIV